MPRRACVALCLGLAALLLLGLSACTPQKSGEFAIYLLDQEISTADFQAAGLSELKLQDQPLIDSPDITGYDPAAHAIDLSPEAYQRVRALFTLPVDVDGIPFVVCVGQERIYGGAFWTPLSSLSFEGVVIMDDLGVNAGRIQLQTGYPSSQAFQGVDPRDDPRIIQALTSAGKLPPQP